MRESGERWVLVKRDPLSEFGRSESNIVRSCEGVMDLDAEYVRSQVSAHPRVRPARGWLANTVESEKHSLAER